MSMDILKLIDFDKINTLLEGFNQSTGFVTAILDLKGNVISKSGWRRICTDFHRVHPGTSQRCTISDTVLAGGLGKTETYHFYECLNGLVDVSVPIVVNGDHVANLFSGQFFFKEPDRSFFQKQAATFGFDVEDYLSALDAVPVVSKEKVTVAMDFLLNMTQLISDITVQKLDQLRLCEALQKSEERSQSVLDQMLEGCQIIGFDWRYLYLNPSAEVHNRMPNNQLLGNRYMDIWPGIESTNVFRVIRKVMEKRIPSHLENEFVFPDGSVGWFDLSIQPVPEGVFVLSIDITERKLTETALRESEEKYRLISDNSDDWIYWIMPDGQLHYISPACERVTGYTPEEFIACPNLINEIIFEADRGKLLDHHRLSQIDKTVHFLEYRIITKTGEIRWIEHTCSPISTTNGEPMGRRGTNKNITERKLQEEQLFESEFRFSNLYENGPFGMVMADASFHFKKANPAFCNIMGYREAELLKFTFKELTHPDDLERDMINIKKLINKEISVYKTEKRYIRKDGLTIWGSLTVTSTYDSEGGFLYYLGIIEDITHRKLAEEEIRRLSERISTATKASQVGIWDWDVEKDCLEWDDQMYILYGLNKADFAGAYEAWLSGLHPEDREFCQQETQLALDGIKVYDTEFRIVQPTGKMIYARAKGEVFRNEDGKPVRMVGINYDVTGQKLMDQKIREKDQEFRKLSANVSGLIFQFTRKTDGSYCVPIASEGIRNIFGCTPEEVVDDFAPIGRVLYPADAERVIRDIEYSAEHLTYFTCEFRVHIPEREIQWIYSQSTPERLPDGSITWYGFNTDITERKIAEEALRESEEKFRLLMESVPLPVVYSDSDGYVLFRNNRFKQVFGYTEDDIFSIQEWWKLAYPDDQYRQWVKQNWESAVQEALKTNGEIESGEYTITCKDGTERTIIINGIIINQNLLATFTDISDRKRAEEEIKRLNETLEQRVTDRTAQLQAVNKELEAFSYSVSHDLRAPLRHINGYVELLLGRHNESLSENARHYLDTIAKAATQMGTLIDDLLQFSRTGRQELHKARFSMNHLVNEVVEKMRPDLVNRKIIWKIMELPEVYGDVALFKLVWMNLLDNAVKYTRLAETAEIEIEYRQEKDFYVFLVRDNGVGFNMKYAHKLFGVFQRLHSQHEFEGTGIGLANVQRIVHKHNGKVWAEAEPNKGAVFCFTLPKYREEKQ